MVHDDELNGRIFRAISNSSRPLPAQPERLTEQILAIVPAVEKLLATYPGSQNQPARVRDDLYDELGDDIPLDVVRYAIAVATDT